MSLHIHISTNGTREKSALWGDTQFAEGLARALTMQGARASLLFRHEKPLLTAGDNIILRIVGPYLDEPVPDLPNLLWIISPPDFAVIPMLRRYQKVFCASQLLAGKFSAFGIDAEYLHQATDYTHFHPGKRVPGAAEIPILFVGAHAARAERQLVQTAIAQGFDVQVWGPGWDDVIPAEMWRGARLDYAELAAVYARARVILNAHMPEMARYGMMSNRSFDGIASGAIVISDAVTGFSAPDLPELVQVETDAELFAALDGAMHGPPPAYAERLARNHRIVANYGFDGIAARLLGAARNVLDSGRTAPPAFRPRPHADPAVLSLSRPEASAATQKQAMLIAAQEVLAIASALETPNAQVALPPAQESEQGVIHPMMTDLRTSQAIALDPHRDDASIRIAPLAARARRLVETLDPEMWVGELLQDAGRADAGLTRVMRNEPLGDHSPAGYSRDMVKSHLRLWPRVNPVHMTRPVGVFMHLFYEELAVPFAERLRLIEVPTQIYVSTDTAEKAGDLRRIFPAADIRVTPNRGRDIYPKFYGFSDVYRDHDIVLHLHGKRSLHSSKLNEWQAHILDCLLPSTTQINRILSMFRSIPALGLVAPLAYRNVMSAAHWGANYELAQELAFRMGLKTDLPGDDHLRFPVGSMFWARVDALQPLLDLHLRPGHFPPESGQVDGTLAHAVERMIGVVCRTQGYHILPVTSYASTAHRGFKRKFDNNRELRAALEAGEFDVPS